MIFAIAAVVILLLIGLSFVSIAGFQRAAGAAAGRAGSTDAVVRSTLQILSQRIAQDTGEYLASSVPEKYMTYPDATHHPWLASVEPTDTNADGAWDAWLQGTLIGTAPADFINAETFASAGATDQTIPLLDLATATATQKAQFASAMGTGYADSRYIKLPFAPTNDLTWVAAIHIDDESARVNLNTATETECANPVSTSARVFGDTPADVNLKRFLSDSSLTSFAAVSPGWTPVPNTLRVIGFDTTTGASLGTNSTNQNTMRWLYQTLGYSGGNTYTTPLTDTVRGVAGGMSRHLDNPFASPFTYNPLPSSDLAKLRIRYATNNPGISSVEKLLDLTTTNNTGVLRASRREGAGFGRSNPSVAQLQADRRHLLTTYSGAVARRPRYALEVTTNSNYFIPTMLGVSGEGKLPLGPVNTANAPRYIAAFQKVFEAAGYEGTPTGTGQPRSTEAAAALVASILGHQSTNVYNPRPEKITNGTVDYYPQKLQPFFKEAVAVWVYQDRVDGVAANQDNPANTLIDHVTNADERIGMFSMIEVGNPYPVTLDLTGFYLRLTYNGTTSEIPMWPLDDGATTIAPGERVVFYPNAAASPAPPADYITEVQNRIEPSSRRRKGVPFAWALPAPANAAARPTMIVEMSYNNGANAVIIDRIQPPGGNPWTPEILTAADALIDTAVVAPGAVDNSFAVYSQSLQRDDSPSGSLGSTVSRVLVTNPGANYSAATLVTLAGGGFTSVARAVPRIVGGRIVSIDVIDVGAGYTGAITVSITDSTGAGAAAIAYRDQGFPKYIYEDPAANVLLPNTVPAASPFIAAPTGVTPYTLSHRMSPVTAWQNTANYESGGTIPPFQLPFNHAPVGGIESIAVTSVGTSYPVTTTVTITDPTGTGATAVPVINSTGQLTGIRVLTPGSNYTNPSVTIAGGGGSGAAATANIARFSIVSTNVSAGGTGYTSPPTVTLNGQVGPALLFARVAPASSNSIVGIDIAAPGFNYTSAPVVAFTGSGSGATVTVGLGRCLRTVGDLGGLLTFAHRYDGTNWIPLSRQLGDSAYGGSRTTFGNGRLNLGAFVPSAAAVPAVPIASLIFDHFTPLVGSPANNFSLYGTININTAPGAVLNSLPYLLEGSALTSSAGTSAWFVGDGVVLYRDKIAPAAGPPDFSPARATVTGITGLRNVNGFSSVGELMMVTKPSPTATERKYIMTGPFYDGADNRLGATNASVGDMTPGPGTPDFVTDDIEEYEVLFNRVSNLVSVRSDVFTAHVLLQGRRFDAVAQKWVVAVQRRFAATFDRSGVGEPYRGIDGVVSGNTLTSTSSRFDTTGTFIIPGTTVININGVGARTVTAVNTATQVTFGGAAVASPTNNYEWYMNALDHNKQVPRLIMFVEDR